MHNKMSATGVLAHLIYILESNLSELTSSAHKDDYIMGSWEACIECLEIIGCWTQAKDYGLNYNPEIKFNMETAQCCCPSTTLRRKK
ncbi:MAG: hypothetical protein K2K38_05160 [Clostridia bacterium]|nr:hypothetical protein [Clostridia bacterium]